jgi:tRNA(Arg) A34 adenosine deaminase TadA
MFPHPHTVSFELPRWIDAFCADYTASSDMQTRMAFVVEAARRNVQEETGGPFAAAVFDADTAELVALGVNLVTTQGLSMLHAEMVAIAVAQRVLGTYDLGENHGRSYELVSAGEPCAMCFGAIPWSGVRRIVCAARDADAREIGFDEGPKHPQWEEALHERGIEVVRDVGRDAAAEVLRFYRDSGGVIYNGRKGL